MPSKSDHKPADAASSSQLIPAKTTVVVPSHKGGIGKSTMTRGSIELLRFHLTSPAAYQVIGVDGDADNGQLLSFLGNRDGDGFASPEQDAMTGILYLDGRSSRERGMLLDLAERDAQLIAIDLPGGSLTDLANLNENLGSRDLVDAHRQAGRRFVVMLPITPLLASISSVLVAIEQFGPDADYVVVKNMAAGKDEDFVLWDPGIIDKNGKPIGGKARQRLMEVNGRILEMPVLSPGIYARIDALGLTFTEALKSPLLATSERLSCRRWLHAWSGQLNRISDLLALPHGYSWSI